MPNAVDRCQALYLAGRVPAFSVLELATVVRYRSFGVILILLAQDSTQTQERSIRM